MQSSSASPNPLRFGLFELDLAKGELRKRGRKVTLQEQPFKLLTLLLRRPGEVVTREELQQALWPADTFVEFDESLNKAVQKLRQALGDSSDNPHLIETVPRRGYRFITPVEPVGHDGQAEEPHSPTTARRLHREGTLWIVALAAAVGIGIALWLHSPALPAPPLRKFTLAPQWESFTPVISPDGRHIAYLAAGPGTQTVQGSESAAQRRLWIWDLDRDQPRDIDGTEGAEPWPFWSPDSEFVGFASKKHLWKVPGQKGGPTPICELSDECLGGTWSLDGNSIVYSVLHQGIYEAPAAGGAPKMLIPVDRSTPGDHFDTPYLLPTTGGDRTLLYASQRIGPKHDIILHSLKSGKRSVLVEDAISPVYSPTGHVLYGRTSLEAILALPFSVAKMKATGNAFRIARNSIEPSVAQDGTLVYPAVEAWPKIQLTWHDSSGHKIATVGGPEGIETMSLSPDGRSVALNIIGDFNESRGLGEGIWILDVSRGTKTRLTSSAQADLQPIWAPTGKEITFCSNRLGHGDIYTAPLDGSGEVNLLVSGPLYKRPDDWSPDGKFLVYEMADPKSRHDLWYLKPKQDGGYESTPFLRTPAWEESARFSPDGQFLAYVSNESGRAEVYVRRFPDGSGVRQISVNGGRLPSWRKNGKELFYLENDSLVSVSVTTKPAFSIGGMRRLFKNPGLAEIRLSAYYFADPMYGVSTDGQRFLFPELVGPVGKPVIHVVENWFEEFKNWTARTP